MPSANAVTTLTRLGFASRGIMYFTIGSLALRSGRTEDGAGALAVLSSGSGQVLLYIMAPGFFAFPGALATAVAAGLLLFGLFSFVEARFRRINDPEVLKRLKAGLA